MSGNFLSCNKSVKVLWKFQRLGVISLETPQRNLLDFLELRQVLSTYDGDPWDPLWWPQ